MTLGVPGGSSSSFKPVGCLNANLPSKYLEYPKIKDDCGSMNVIGCHYLIGRGTTRRCGFTEMGVALLEEVCHCGGGL